ncbi:GPI mannosyltransferase 4-like [Branchiostoma lanceolatum]|uniref:GPI mannosyltransferase 4-like n=1 Tax=Branchiostoma lanceolatum TaxID=7740 RepID=UPI003452A452
MEAVRVWLALSVLRVIWVLLPQSGYIHPDEFFQSSEVMAGRVLDYKVHLTWEWSEDFPARSPIYPFFTSGIPFLVLKAVNYLGLLPDSIGAYALLVAPRLWTTILSFLIDLCLYKICSSVKEKWTGVEIDAFKCMAVFSASYVTLVFFTRTFSNILETVLFVVIIGLVINYIKGGDPENREKKNGSDEVDDRYLSKSHSVVLSVLIVVGFFNRPNFPAFAFVPMLYWAFYPISQSKGLWLKMVILKCLRLVPVAIAISTVFVVCDSVYFGSLDIHSISMDRFLHSPSSFLRNLTVTPLNLLSYNFDKSKLEQHGLHPRVTHLFVNTPLLFGVLAILAFRDAPYLLRKVFHCVRHGENTAETKNSDESSSNKPVRAERNELETKGSQKSYCRELDIEMFFLLCYFIPIFIMSLVAHHEPRYISPCLVPLVLAYHRNFAWKGVKKLLFVGFVVGNVLGGVLFGVLHQGGVVPSLLHLHDLVHQQQSTTTMHIIYFHTYTPPGHLLGIHSNQRANQSIGMVQMVTNDNEGPQVHLHALEGAPINVLFDKLRILYQQKRVSSNTQVTYIVSPSTLHSTFYKHGTEMKIVIVLREVFFPHLSLEDPPRLQDIVQTQSEEDSTLLERLRFTFGLNLYEVM